MRAAAPDLDFPAHAALAGGDHAQAGRLACDAAVGPAEIVLHAAIKVFLVDGGDEGDVDRRWIGHEIAQRQHEGDEAALVVHCAAPIKAAVAQHRAERSMLMPLACTLSRWPPHNSFRAPLADSRAITLGRPGNTGSSCTFAPWSLSQAATCAAIAASPNHSAGASVVRKAGLM